MIVLDDVVPQNIQDDIEALLLGNRFPWYYNLDMEYDFEGFELPSMVASTGFNHAFFMDGKQISPFLTKVYPVLTEVLASQSMELKKFLRCKANLTAPKFPFDETTHNIPHVDQIEQHHVLLYYVNDSDGDTVFFNESYKKGLKTPTVCKKVSPKKGRVVLFDGMRYHCASNPINSDVRVIINYNFIL